MKVIKIIIVSVPHRLADPLPGLPEPVHGGVGEGSTDLHHPIVVMKTPTDVSNCGPLL